jgi:hypothetical protein
MVGRYEEALAAVDPDRDFGEAAALIYESMGRMDEVIAVYDRRLALFGARPGHRAHTIVQIIRVLRDTLLNNAGDTFPSDLLDFPDPEGAYYLARARVRAGAYDQGIDFFDRAERGGFFCHPFFIRDSWLEPIRGDARFMEILRRAEMRCREATRAFEEHPASRILTVGVKR